MIMNESSVIDHDFFVIIVTHGCHETEVVLSLHPIGIRRICITLTELLGGLTWIVVSVAAASTFYDSEVIANKSRDID